MKIAVLCRSAGISLVPAYGATIRDEGHRGSVGWTRRETNAHGAALIDEWTLA
jgi:hypothetical protein